MGGGGFYQNPLSRSSIPSHPFFSPLTHPLLSQARTSVSDLSEEEQLRLAIAASMNSMQKSSSLSSAAASMDQSETIVIDDDEIDRAVVEAVVASIDGKRESIWVGRG